MQWVNQSIPRKLSKPKNNLNESKFTREYEYILHCTESLTSRYCYPFFKQIIEVEISV